MSKLIFNIYNFAIIFLILIGFIFLDFYITDIFIIISNLIFLLAVRLSNFPKAILYTALIYISSIFAIWGNIDIQESHVFSRLIFLNLIIWHVYLQKNISENLVTIKKQNSLMKFKRVTYFLLLFFFTTCNNKKLPTIENFDTSIWVDDKFACNNERPKLLKALVKNKDKIIGLSQNQILQLLGKPEIRDMQKRGIRHYVYFVKKGWQCKKDGTFQRPQYIGSLPKDLVLILRFNAVDKVNEIQINQ